jgi:hypothetical protein
VERGTTTSSAPFATPPTTTRGSTGTTVAGDTGGSGGGGKSTASLAKLMPDQGSSDPAGSLQVSSCTPVTQAPSGMTGVKSSYACTSIPGRSGWELFAFQFSSAGNYASSLDEYNFDQNFLSGAAGNACPVAASEEGLTSWQTSAYPSRRGQVLECLSVVKSGSSNYQSAYIWTLPSQDTFFEVVASAAATPQQLAQWWAQDGQPGAA